VTRDRPLTGNAEGVAWPPVFAQHAHLAALALTQQRTQWLSADELAAKQGEQLALVSAHHAHHSPWFAERLGGAVLDHPDALPKLPILTRADAQGLAAQAQPPVPQSHMPLVEVQSSGSSGVPVIARKTQLTRLMWMAMTLRYHEWAERGPYGRMATIRPNLGFDEESPDWGAPISLFHATGPVRRINVAIPLDQQVAILRDFRPDTLIAYPSNLGALLEMPEGRAALSTVRSFRPMGETVTPEFRKSVKAATGIAPFDCYSTEEVGYVAIQCPESTRYHIMSESLIVEILHDDGTACAPGETGRVVATDLMNYAMPFIRYDTGDYAVAGKPCRCGRGLPTIERIAGRYRGMITKPDGSRHWPLTGIYGYRKIAQVRQYQMIQHEIDRIELRLVTDPLTPEQHDAFQALLRQRLGDGIRFEIVRFADRLPPGPRGKTDEFISLVGDRP
jgi:phenylacetate-CoA ligase